MALAAVVGQTDLHHLIGSYIQDSLQEGLGRCCTALYQAAVCGAQVLRPAWRSLQLDYAGLLDLLSIVKAGTTDKEWVGMATEGYVFVAATFWVFCFGMSRYSIWLENKLHTGHKR